MATTDITGGAGGDDPPRRRRRIWPALALAGLVVGVVPLSAAGALWLRLAAGPLELPASVTMRVEAALDAAMPANGVTLERLAVSRAEGAARFDVQLINLRLTDPDGSLRAAFPEVSVTLSAQALARGEIRPISVDLDNAGLGLSRDADGQIDLALTGGGEIGRQSLPDTLARLDQMFAAPAFAELGEVTASGLSLAMADAVTGQVMRVSDARMRLERKNNVLTVTLGGALSGSRDATIDIALSRAAATGATNIGFAFTNLSARDVATVGPVLAWVDLMRAPISGFMGGALNDDGSVGDLRATLDIGAGQVTLDGAATPLRFDSLTAAMRYDASAGRIVFDSVALRAPDLSLDAAGHADVSPDGTRYTAQFRMTDIIVARTDLYPEPLELDGAMADLRLTLSPEVVIEIGQAVIHDAGLELHARGRIASHEEGLDIAFDAHVPEARAREALTYWPPAMLPDTRGWIAERLTEGRLSGVDLAVRARPGAAPVHDLSFDFDGVRLLVLPDLPPIEGGVGYLSLSGPRLILQLDEGALIAPGGAAVAIDGSRMVIADTSQRGPEAVIDLAVAGELTDVLTLLTRPPVRLFAGGAMTPAQIGSGGLSAEGHITTRLMRHDGTGGVDYAFAGEIGGFASDTLVPGRSLTAERLQVEVDPSMLRIAGQATFDGVPLTGQWTRPLGAQAARASLLEARTGLSRDRLAALGVTLPEWMLSGEAPADIVVSLPDGAPPQLRVSSDLAGAALALPPLGWALTAGQTGRFEAEILLGPDPAVTRLALQGNGLDMLCRISLAPGGGLDRLTADRVRLDGWLDVTGALVGRGGARPPGIEVTGGTLDLRGAPQGGGVGGIVGGPISATLDRLQISEGIALTALSAEMTSDGGLSGQFRGRVNGEAPVTGTLVSTPNGSAVRVRAEDGGAVLRAAGVFRTAHGGAMELILQATGATGTYDGTLSIENPRLRDAPVMAELLNLISVVGLLEQLSGEGINLGSVDARFRLTPAQVILQQGTAVGPALGLSLDGTYTLGTRALDMQGVVSPLYVVNGLVGALFAPRREGLFGFSYRLTGRADNPQVFVNPLSILTPGVFRDIFRRPPPELTGN
ncbi:AsmA-like C-terminal region-containing protein [Roseicyclus mahoneyensis]|uniref:Uncharacterized protein DUF3971 n=1 Tax=Roseicyclus mahoneyensis TaxID=164332 RepID=A0A316GPF2_9RHOB|nr:AsmA-like C-terminal region-containing protein [Roseicyclus mahoneyensis]PWK62251.1 uncharacterized protein DUF3971 [Roseicyclus mahoneyensis]